MRSLRGWLDKQVTERTPLGARTCGILILAAAAVAALANVVAVVWLATILGPLMLLGLVFGGISTIELALIVISGFAVLRGVRGLALGLAAWQGFAAL